MSSFQLASDMYFGRPKLLNPVILISAPLLMRVAKGSDGNLVASALMVVITLVIWVPVILIINAARFSFHELLIFYTPLISNAYLQLRPLMGFLHGYGGRLHAVNISFYHHLWLDNLC
jgi:energy-converting hydrogenase Eha subunit A